MEFINKGKMERGGKEIKKEDANFEFSKTESLFDAKENDAIKIELLDKSEYVGFVTIEELNDKELGKEYVQLRLINIEPKYQGGNASTLLYEKSIECAESLSKKLLFDSSLTIAAYKSFKKLENLGYKVIENPDAIFDGSSYLAPRSWVLRVERIEKNKEE